VIIAACDVRFDLLRRPAGGGGDVTIATFTHHFDPKPPQPDGHPDFSAVAYEDTASAAAVDARAGDLLVWRFSVSGTTAPTAYIPNGDGANAQGRIPFIDLP
jgi:hypothetical protein